ncbi:hypothetical protein SEA_BEUFFERT_183 [Streptomyces phage Beuffert]|nr:hypothetical protein SEA_BEUFFERT_183 [Streptomyces phage Beuffert]
MPSGYTAELYEGEQSFEDFVKKAARAMGAYMHLRDEPSDTPLTKRTLDVSYYIQRIDKAQTEYDEFTAMSEDEQRGLYQKFLDNRKEYEVESNEQTDALAARYGEMLARVISWRVPDELDGLKDFMREQLEASINFDCGYRGVNLPTPTFEEWRDEKVDQLERDKVYYGKRMDEEKQRVKEQNEYHDALMKALGLL